jgi:5'-deoxynucleotidase YfbR-like HD superfamily hydrolase
MNFTIRTVIFYFMNQKQITRLTNFFFEMGNLRKVLRSHQQLLLTYDLTDTIASHSFRVAFIGYFLAKELGADADKVLKMCLMHDIEESRSMDHHWVSKKYVKVYQEEITNDQFDGLPNSGELVELINEYEERKTEEAKIAKDADMLDQILLLREYQWQGNQEAAQWLRTGSDGEQERIMTTDLAHEIAKEIKEQKPSDWWASSWTPKRR